VRPRSGWRNKVRVFLQIAGTALVCLLMVAGAAIDEVRR
jgi:hypothetical protein